MKEPIREILPETPEQLKAINLRLSGLLNEAINMGTHLIKWDIIVEREGKDYNIPTLFLRNIVELADSISILISHSSIDPCKIILRTLLENCFSLMYMIEKDEKQRSLSFSVYKTIQNIKDYNKWISNESSHNNLLEVIEKDDLDIDIDKFIDHPENIAIKKQKEKLLTFPGYSEVYEEYKRTKKQYGRGYFNWYSLFNGPTNFRGLADYLGKSMRYEFFFKNFSDFVHGTSIMKGIVSAGNGEGQIIQIRDFRDTESIFSQTVSLLTETYTVFINQRLQDRKQEYLEWYSNFRIPYLEIVKTKLINYKE
jgi:hypothetical protein